MRKFTKQESEDLLSNVKESVDYLGLQLQIHKEEQAKRAKEYADARRQRNFKLLTAIQNLVIVGTVAYGVYLIIKLVIT